MNPKIKKALLDPYFSSSLVLNQIGRFVSDEQFVKWSYYLKFRKRLNLSNPQTYNEKLQWLKLYDRHEEYTQMVDKYEAKKYVASVIGEEYIIPTLGVYDSFDEINFDELPNQFVLKCTHNSGGIVICKDKQNLDIKKSRKLMNKWMKKNPFWSNREYPYKHVKPRIIAEQYMEDESGYELKDYKFFCFDGDVKYIFVATDRGKEYEETKFDFFDMDWNHLPFTNGHPNNPEPIKKPENFEKMKALAHELSKGMPHVRVDLYNICGSIYFGELTFFHWSGMTPFVPEEWDYKFGECIKLPASSSVQKA